MKDRTDQNLTAGSAPQSNFTFDNNNRMIGYTYDLNGNLTAMPGVSNMTYDVFNRVVSTTPSGGQARAAKYDPFGRRIARQISAEIIRVYFHDMGGRMLAEYDYMGSGWPPSRKYEYFAGQRVGQYTDRLGSVRRTSGTANSHYYPFGEEITGASNDTYKFADTNGGILRRPMRWRRRFRHGGSEAQSKQRRSQCRQATQVRFLLPLTSLAWP